MKSKKMFVSAAISCLLAGASGASMAVDCPSGFILNETVDEIRIDGGTGCSILDTIVIGDVIVNSTIRFFMKSSRVLGRIEVRGGEDTAIVETTVSDGTLPDRIVVQGASGDTLLSNNVLAGDGNMVVSDNLGEGAEVLIYSNEVGGDIRCQNNEPGAELALANIAGGTITCIGQEPAPAP